MDRAIYRIIDANFNRAREAARVIEEYCRFALNCEGLTGRAKQFRHELCRAIAKLDSGKLIASRDTVGDVGVGQLVDGQLRRGDLKDGLTAACKRLTEALRALGETTQTINGEVAAVMENLRYRAYTLEKDIVLFGDAAEKFGGVRLYVLITSCEVEEVISMVNDCAAGGADCIQLRAKGMCDDELFGLAEAFVGRCRENGVLSIINDRVDIAVAAGANGVHLGQEDLPVEQAKGLQLRPLIIGKSTHSIEQLRAACQEEVTYVALGPVFATVTKPEAKTVGVDYVRAAVKELEGKGIANVAIGGIGAENVGEVLAAGARAVAVCGAVTGVDDAAGVCREIKELIPPIRRISALPQY